MKILHIVDYLMPEIGYQEFLLPKWNAIHGHDVTIITSDRYAPIPNYQKVWGGVLGERICGEKIEKKSNVTIIRLKTIEFFRRPFIIGLRNEITQLKPDVIWLHGTASPSAFSVAVIAKQKNISLIEDNHQCFIAARRGIVGFIYHQILTFLSKVFLNNQVDQFIGVAKECCDFLETRQGIPKEKIKLLPLGVDTEIFQFNKLKRNELRYKFGIGLDDKVIMQTGKLDETRKPEWLASAVNEIMKDHYIHCIFLGSAHDERIQKLKDLIDAKYCKQIHFISFVPQSELSHYFSMSDICVYPDSNSLSCFEAASTDNAVVLNDLPASQERVSKGVGVGFKRSDVNDLKNVIEKLISDQDYFEQVKKRSKEAVIKEFSYDSIARKSETIMQDLIKEAIGSGYEVGGERSEE